MSSRSSSDLLRNGGKVEELPAEGYALSPIQAGMLFHWALDGHSGTDIEQIVGELCEPIDPFRLAEAWQGAVDHYSTLRTAFAWEGRPAPLQYVQPVAKVEFTFEDLRKNEESNREQRSQAFLRSDRRAGFDLTHAPLMRVTLFQMEDAHFRMIWTFHHILLDGRSFEFILGDVFARYAGETSAAADRPYRKYIEWVHQQDHAASRVFWRRKLAGFTGPTPIPPARSDVPAADDFQRCDIQLSPDDTRRVRTLASREGLSLNSILLGAWALILAQSSGTHDVVFGASKTTRRASIPDADSMVGLFLATIPVRIAVDFALPVTDWLRRVRAEWIALRGHEHLPLVDIRNASDVLSSSALFDSLVMYDTGQLDSVMRARGPEWSNRRFSTFEQTGLPLTLLAYGDGEALALRLEYDTRRVDQRTAMRWLDHLGSVLGAWGHDATGLVADSPAMQFDERAGISDASSATPSTGSHDDQDRLCCVHELIEQQVERTPDAVAVVFGQETLTYRELNAHANQMASKLRSQGVGPDTLVGICVDRSLEMIVCLLGILKAGGAYVPLDPAYPSERLSLMLQDSRVRTVVTQSHLVERLGVHEAATLLADRLPVEVPGDCGNGASGVAPHNLAYVIFTSGSTGRPKGTMIEHRSLGNFIAGMDKVIGGRAQGVWLAMTSISFDISVLELFWTLARGFKVIIAPSFDSASLQQRAKAPRASSRAMDFGLFYFAAHSNHAKPGDAYRLLTEGAKFADEHGFTAVWTPERHFHAFGGFYPNPAVTTAALSTITTRIQLRAGSIVLPLHNPLRVAEDWAVIDQLSGGRVGLSFASGWHVDDFAFMPENFERRREVMCESIDTVMRLWRGESIAVRNGAGKTIDVTVLPRPIQAQPPIWIASAGSVETFVLAGRLGANVLTNMLGQDLADLKQKFAAYRAARREHGYEGEGTITVMLHTFVNHDSEEARRLARKPFSDYLASSYDLVKVAPSMFPAFRQPSRSTASSAALDQPEYTEEDMAALLEHAFDRYFDTAGLFGTPERALTMVDQLSEIGATEIACLIDFGIDPEIVLESLKHLDRLRRLCAERASRTGLVDSVGEGVAGLMRRHGVTHLQCTPSVARALADDAETLDAIGDLDTLLLGGEALPVDLAERLSSAGRSRILNMYGPTETTVWSTSSVVTRGAAPTIGRPILNTSVYLLDERQQPVPPGTAGELYIGGEGVVRGYLDRADLTNERFLDDPFAGRGRMYRTGDLARLRLDGELEYLGRIDDQVKVDGYRIELGEIEVTLSRHALVQQCVVTALGSPTGTAQRLVAYVVPSHVGTLDDNANADRVEAWQQIWNDAYTGNATPDSARDPRFLIVGWNDSSTGRPIPDHEMREWLDGTVDRILALAPRRILEIGCGSGLILFRVLPNLEHYTGLDISAVALDGIRQELTSAEGAKTTLLHRSVDDLSGIPRKSLDLVVINSVAQYFPSSDYLTNVLRCAAELVVDGGFIFVGDVRSLEHLEYFHSALEIRQGSGVLDRASAQARIARRVAQESELVLSPRFFEDLLRDVPRLSRLDSHLKRGRSRNELTMFRYDVVLSVNSAARRLDGNGLKVSEASSIEMIEAELAGSPDYLYCTDLANTRLSGVSAATSAIRDNSEVGIMDLLALLDRSAGGVDPESLYTLSAAYDVQTRWAQSGDPARFDALFGRRGGEHVTSWPALASERGTARTRHANTPAKRGTDEMLGKQLRAHLRTTLPEYMIPSTFVTLEALPLTPNGKIDRKALPSPERGNASLEGNYAAPDGDLELQIVNIWRDLLALERVGRHDNIFDMGANSLLAMQANSRLSAQIGRTIPLVSMFRYPTVATLAAHVGTNGQRDPIHSTGERALARTARSEQAAERRRALRAQRDHNE